MVFLDEAKDYFLGRCNEIISMANCGDPWVFLCGSAMIDYLTQMTTGDSGRCAYISFVDAYFKEVNPAYNEFRFADGQQDLPTQMYLILRCGIVHKFSLVPGDRERRYGGRIRSILLAHERNGHENAHLTSYTNNGMDSVLFIAEQFAKDIKSVVEQIFLKATHDSNLKEKMTRHLSEFPPIMGNFT